MNKVEVDVTGSDASTTTTSLYETEQKQLQKKMDDYTIYNGAIDTLDITVCEKIIGNDALKTECLDNVYSANASKEKNVALCDKIQDTSTKARCTNGFAYDSAIVSGKQSDCDKIIGDNDLKNACMKNIVFAKIEDQSFSGTTDACTSLTGADKDYCVNRIKKSADIELLQKGTTTKDLDICAKIQDVGMKNICNDTVYMPLALERKDGSLCAKITDVSRKASCTTQFTRINDVTLLQKSLADNSISLCATITTTDLRTKCSDTLFLKQAVASKDAAMCAKIFDTSTKVQCNNAVKVILDQINKQK